MAKKKVKFQNTLDTGLKEFNHLAAGSPIVCIFCSTEALELPPLTHKIEISIRFNLFSFSYKRR